MIPSRAAAVVLVALVATISTARGEEFSNTFSTKGNPKAYGLNATVLFPKGWKVLDQQSSVGTFATQKNGYGLMLNINVGEFKGLSEAQCRSLDKAAWERFLVGGTPADAPKVEITASAPNEFSAKPGWQFTHRMTIPNAKGAMVVWTQSAVACYGNKMVSLGCSSYGRPGDSGRAPPSDICQPFFLSLNVDS